MGGVQGGGEGSGILPLRRDRGEVRVFVAVAGKGLSCPARGGCEVVSQSRTWGPSCDSPGMGRLQQRPGRSCGDFPWCLQAQLPRSFLGRVTVGTPASRWLCDPCLALCSRWPVSSTGSWAPNLSERGSPERVLWARSCVWGVGDGDRGLGVGGWGWGPSRLCPWLHV